jgi:hypothetical protein
LGNLKVPALQAGTPKLKKKNVCLWIEVCLLTTVIKIMSPSRAKESRFACGSL